MKPKKSVSFISKLNEDTSARQTFLEQQKLFSGIIKRELKLIKYIFFLVFFYCIAWTPYALLCLIGQFSTDIENLVTPYTTVWSGLFAKLSTIFNPILYTLNNRHFTDFVKEKIFKQKPKKPNRYSLSNRQSFNSGSQNGNQRSGSIVTVKRNDSVAGVQRSDSISATIRNESGVIQTKNN